MFHSDWDFVNSLWPVVLHSCTSGDVFAAAKSVLVSTHHNDASLARIRPDRDTFVFRVVACSDAELHLLRRAGDLEVCFIWFDLFSFPLRCIIYKHSCFDIFVYTMDNLSVFHEKCYTGDFSLFYNRNNRLVE